MIVSGEHEDRVPGGFEFRSVQGKGDGNLLSIDWMRAENPYRLADTGCGILTGAEGRGVGAGDAELLHGVPFRSREMVRQSAHSSIRRSEERLSGLAVRLCAGREADG